MASADAGDAGLKRHLTLRSGIGLVVGGIIGSGIFLTPNSVFAQCGSIGASLTVWVLAGLLSLCGALCYCELGTCIPETGGEHVYFQRAFGPLPAFAFIWSLLLVVSPVSTALICLTFARYAIKPFYGHHSDVPEEAEKQMAVAAIGTYFLVYSAACKQTELLSLLPHVSLRLSNDFISEQASYTFMT